MLVNNAGFGTYGNFLDLPLERELAMIRLHVETVVALCKLFGGDMTQRGSGRIMNVGSLLSFLPFPYYTVYSATKAFVLAFSETLTAELKDRNVVVTALCPGPVDTEFNSPEMLKTNAFHSNHPVSANDVAQAGVQLLLKGKGTKVVGRQNQFVRFLAWITPSSIMSGIKKNLASQHI